MTQGQKISLLEFLKLAGFDDEDLCFEDIFVTANPGFSEALTIFREQKFRHYLEIAKLSDVDFDELYNMRGRGAVINHLIANSFHWGYDSRPNQPVKIKFFFGKKGLVFTVEDFGKGFDAEKLLAAHATGRLRRGEHYHNQGIGLGLFINNDRYKISILSSINVPTGTCIAVYYRYTSAPHNQAGAILADKPGA